MDGGSSGASRYNPDTHTIVLVGRTSVVTLLHEFAHALGLDQLESIKWSVNLYARAWPERAMDYQGGLIVATRVRAHERGGAPVEGHVRTFPERVEGGGGQKP